MDNESDFLDKKEAEYLLFEKHLQSKGWKFIMCGRHRSCYVRGNVVIKIPHFMEPVLYTGIDANRKEYILYRKFRSHHDPRNGARYAPCRLLPNGSLMMRAVKDCFDDSRYEDDQKSWTLPGWCYDLKDGPQVGTDKNGIVMAYDYAEEVIYFK